MQYLLPLLAAVAVAKSVGNHFNISIYDMQIKKKRFPFLHHRLKFRSRSGQRENAVTCEQIMATKVVLLREHEEVVVVEDALRTTHNGFPVVHTTWANGVAQHFLRGFVTRQQLLTLLSRRELVAGDSLRPLGGRPGGQALGSSGWRTDSGMGLNAMMAPPAITAEHAEIDAAMRTFFHRHSFYNRHTMTGNASLQWFGSCSFAQCQSLISKRIVAVQSRASSLLMIACVFPWCRPGDCGPVGAHAGGPAPVRRPGAVHEHRGAWAHTKAMAGGNIG